jgi:hypothetical protein
MRKVPLAGAAAAVVLGLAGVVATSGVSRAAAPSVGKSTTLAFSVVFSPLNLIAANNVRNPKSPIAPGDEIVEHDQPFAGGHRVGDDMFSCVVVSAPPAAPLANCTAIFRLPGGNTTTQSPAVPGPAPKDLALTGGTGTYPNAGSDTTLVEFGPSTEADPPCAEPCPPGPGSLTRPWGRAAVSPGQPRSTTAASGPRRAGAGPPRPAAMRHGPQAHGERAGTPKPRWPPRPWAGPSPTPGSPGRFGGQPLPRTAARALAGLEEDQPQRLHVVAVGKGP